VADRTGVLLLKRKILPKPPKKSLPKPLRMEGMLITFKRLDITESAGNADKGRFKKHSAAIANSSF
jgi:hypothetical protein